jgi:hypothetical protein
MGRALIAALAQIDMLGCEKHMFITESVASL